MRCPCCNGYVYKCDSSPCIKNNGWYQLLHYCTGCGEYLNLVECGGNSVMYVQASRYKRPVKYPMSGANEEIA